MTVPVTMLSSIDTVLRDTAVFSVLTDLPGTGVLRQDLDPAAGTLRRVISDVTGIAQDETILLEHTCLGCAVRADLLPALRDMAASGRWERIVVALPVSAESAAASHALCDPRDAAELGVALASVVTVLDTDTAAHDVMGEDLLADRALALSVDDRRSVGEALAAQISHTDLVLTVGADEVGTTLADHLRGVRSHRFPLFGLDPAEWFTPRHVAAHARARLDPRTVAPPAAANAHGVWSLDLSSRRPLHPERFVARLGALSGGRVRSRGRFRLATRPDTVGVWNGAGGQLSIGDAGGWQGFTPSTRLVFTGLDEHRARITRAFAESLLTDAELASADWPGRADGLDDWLGAR
ncbi:GTP-binding protein [Nakamurella flavida]|uniref:GTP-binding protein n=1 Tax=Nakamurella flavida TaxID=363630 RepID=A0A938YHW1_9ACTN|nr:GTP-binding protein [Nakamurella flavida]MBM9477980.1 GTP-binding protein [Nakamurella flavida]MDP9778304.1 G3E family GTPase [Nakamurella flavida]